MRVDISNQAHFKAVFVGNLVCLQHDQLIYMLKLAKVDTVELSGMILEPRSYNPITMWVAYLE